MKKYIQPQTAIHHLELTGTLCYVSNEVNPQSDGSAVVPFNPGNGISEGDGSDGAARRNFWEF